MLGRVRARAGEMAVRLSLGVSRSRLLRQLLTEGLVLSLVGCAAGMAVAYAGVSFFQTIPTGPQVVIDPRIDGRVLIFSLLVAIASAVLCSIGPARLAGRPARRASLRVIEGVEGAFDSFYFIALE